MDQQKELNAVGFPADATPEQKLAILTANILRSESGFHGALVESIIGGGKKATAIIGVIVYSDGSIGQCVYGLPDAIEKLADVIRAQWGTKPADAPGAGVVRS